MLRLKENPREWQKFTLVMVVVVNALTWLLWRRGHVPDAAWFALIGVTAVALIASWLRPAWFRGFYRGGMTVSFHIGQAIGKIVLLLMFFLIVTPMGLLLRLAGKDLLRLRQDPQAKSYWHPAKSSREFDRQF